MNLEKKEVMNLKELSSYCGLSKSTLYKKCMRKELPFYKLNGATLYFKTSEIDKWLFKTRVVSLEDLNIANPNNESI